jgi:AraC-like DNA-binding protein
MYLLRRTDRSEADVCLDVGFASLGTFSRTFREVVGQTPSEYRAGAGADARGPLAPSVPTCFAMAWGRPSSFGEAGPRGVG